MENVTFLLCPLGIVKPFENVGKMKEFAYHLPKNEGGFPDSVQSTERLTGNRSGKWGIVATMSGNRFFCAGHTACPGTPPRARADVGKV